MSNDLIKLSWVAITGCYVSLGCSFILISPPRGDECGEVAVVWVEGYAVVAVRAVKDSLPFVTGYRVCLMKWALCVVGFTCSMKIECLKVHCAERLTIFLCTHNHAVAPCHWFTHWYWFKDSEHHVLIKAFLYVCLPVKWSAVGLTMSLIGAPPIRGSGWWSQVLNVLVL